MRSVEAHHEVHLHPIEADKDEDMAIDEVTPAAPAGAVAQRISRVLFGTDAERGNAVTWHFTPIGGPDVDGRTFLVERVEGTVKNPDIWMQAHKRTTIATEAEILELERAVGGEPAL